MSHNPPIGGGLGSDQEGDFNGVISKRSSAHIRENSYRKGWQRDTFVCHFRGWVNDDIESQRG